MFLFAPSSDLQIESEFDDFSDSLPWLLHAKEFKNFINSRVDEKVTILIGANNSGKSFILKTIFYIKNTGSMALFCNRFSEVKYVSSLTEEHSLFENIYSSFVSTYRQNKSNTENNYFELDNALGILTDDDRTKVFDIFSAILENKIQINLTDSRGGNSASKKKIYINHEPIEYFSAGIRLLLHIVATLCNKSFNTILIDEPELGLNPGVQHALSKYLTPSALQTNFPHIKQVFIATHSHIFLDKEIPMNNFIVTTEENLNIKLTEISSQCELFNVNYRLLGESLTNILLPEAFIFVEGKTDTKYIRKILELYLPEKKFIFIEFAKDGGVIAKLRDLNTNLSDWYKTLYQDRVFVLQDRPKTGNTKRNEIIKEGVPENNIIFWKKNEIEYYYPLSILQEVYQALEEENLLDKLIIENGKVTFNAIEYSKDELCELVIERLDISTELSREIEAVLKILKSKVDTKTL